MMEADPRRWWGLGALALALLALGFDITILNVAMATLSAELDASTSELQWILDSYVLVFAALLLPAGLLGDRFGRKRLLLAGLAVFGAASLGGALADGPAGVIAARAFMGVGAAIITPLSMSILPSIFPPEERTRAVAVWTAAMSLGLPLGPLVGGWLLEHYWWGSIFLINVPVIVAAGIAVALLLPESRDPSAPRVDVPGALLSMGGLTALVYGVIEAPLKGWGDPEVLSAFGAAAILLVNFILWETHARQPMMDVALFGDRRFLWAALTGTAVSLVMAGLLFVLPQYLQVVQGNGTLGTGLRLIPMLLGLMVGGAVTDRLVSRVGHKPIMIAGLFTLAAGLGWGALTGSGSSQAFTAGWLSVVGVGIGLAMVPAMDTVLGILPADEAGRGSGLVQTLRQTGVALGVAGLGSLLSSIYRDRLETGRLPEEVGSGGVMEVGSGGVMSTADAARDSIGGAAAVAERLRDGGLLSSARDAYVAGMNGVLTVCAIGIVGMAALVWLFQPGHRPKRAVPVTPPEPTSSPHAPESGHEHVAS